MYKESNQLSVDTRKCIDCLQCVRDCPASAIVVDKNGKICSAEGGNERCIHCQHCLMVCPTGALSIDGINPSDCIPTAQIPEYKDMISLIRQRRSIRAYKQKNVDKNVIDELVSDMRFVPTGVNFRNLHVSVIDDIGSMNKFRDELYEKIITLFESGKCPPELERFSSMYNAIKAKRDPVFRGAPHALIVSANKNAPCAQVDPMILLSYFELLSKTRGIGTCWCGWLLLALKYLAPAMIEKLELPENHEIVYAMLFGVPSIEYKRSGMPSEISISKI